MQQMQNLIRAFFIFKFTHFQIFKLVKINRIRIDPRQPFLAWFNFNFKAIGPFGEGFIE